MSWYAVHVVLVVYTKNEDQDRFPVVENILLVPALSSRHAEEFAVRMSLEEEGDDDGTFTWNDKPAKLVFKGVRKVVEQFSSDLDIEKGTEVSYLRYVLSNESDVKKLLECEPVSLIFEE